MPPTKAKDQTNSRSLQKPIAKTKRTKQQKLETLLKEAMKHPGVADVMKVYQNSIAAEETFSFYQFFQNPLPEAATSASSAPALC